ncbi:unnamed protein product [Owenia fusiformis]|uniref:Uncharacterized protein n=1 Tax=Owenia fusiformis TaxID=6347 RepID=A0A8S4QA74_OWEFU|nr:unnamed protein product [Owenia fusiformis]
MTKLNMIGNSQMEIAYVQIINEMCLSEYGITGETKDSACIQLTMEKQFVNGKLDHIIDESNNFVLHINLIGNNSIDKQHIILLINSQLGDLQRNTNVNYDHSKMSSKSDIRTFGTHTHDHNNHNFVKTLLFVRKL